MYNRSPSASDSAERPIMYATIRAGGSVRSVAFLGDSESEATASARAWAVSCRYGIESIIIETPASAALAADSVRQYLDAPWSTIVDRLLASDLPGAEAALIEADRARYDVKPVDPADAARVCVRSAMRMARGEETPSAADWAATAHWLAWRVEAEAS